MKWGAVIAAAGRGTRLQRPKHFLEVAGAPLVSWCMRTFAQMPEVSEVVVVTEADSIGAMIELAERIFSIPARVVPGGATRQESVGRGLVTISSACDAVFIHDGARPLVRADDVRAGMALTREGRAAVLGAPCIDTVKIIDVQTRIVQRTLDRATLWAAQTPQFGTLTDLRRAYERARTEGVQATDDTALLEHAGVEVIMVPASGANTKVTNPEDVAIVETLLKGHGGMRVGYGFDAHRLVSGRKFILGGVIIPHDTGALGHSDADVLSHAVSDALLGAAALGDLGVHFPDSDARWKDADSMQLLARCVEMLKHAGFQIENVDATIVVQQPKLASYLVRIRENVAHKLGIPLDRVNVKAKTSEGMGYTGDGSGIAAHAVACIRRES